MSHSEPIVSSGPQKKHLAFIAALYLLGIFMGAIDTGIVTPARTVIQSHLGVGDKTGIWMITIFTLSYAASIPIAGKLADRLGRKYIYMASILLFGIGSLICGLSQTAGSFPILLIGRVIQAIGGGGIIPVANAEFGTSFPEEKRGMALGLIGGVYGIANILGATAGSAILDIAGAENWRWLFFINLPIALAIIISGLFFLPNNRTDEAKKIDFGGIAILVIMILSLLYGLRNINFFDFTATVKTLEVYPFLIAFAILVPIFILIEKKVEDPVLNLKYFTDKRILITLILSTLVGVSMMGMIFVPQFSENALRIASGSGGYFVTILGFFSGLAAPISGRLIDKYGPKKVLFAGFAVSTSGALFLSFVASKSPSLFSVLVSLALIGIGLGFSIGTPLNYMMLQNTKKNEASSALAALSLMRSIGTTVAPAIMIGFLAQAGLSAQTSLMNMLPKPQAPKIVQVQEVKAIFDEMKKNPAMAEKLKVVNIPDFDKMTSIEFNMSGGKLPADVLKNLQTADVTNIVDRTKAFSERMFNDNTPQVITKIEDGIQKGIDGMNKGLAGIKQALGDMQKGADGLNTALAEMQKGKQDDNTEKQIQNTKAKLQNLLIGIEQLKGAQVLQEKAINKMIELKAAIRPAFKQSKTEYLNNIEKMRPQIEEKFQSSLSNGFKQMYLTVSILSILAMAILLFYRKPDVI